MINLLSAATSTPKNVFKTTELANSLMHKLSPELINTLNSLGVDQRYSVMDNYPDFLSGKAMNATSSTLELGVGADVAQGAGGRHPGTAPVAVRRLGTCFAQDRYRSAASASHL